jgi:heme/copper-type cytochrome/quinol oxidase subunit 2
VSQKFVVAPRAPNAHELRRHDTSRFALIAPLVVLTIMTPAAQAPQPVPTVVKITAERFAFFPSEVTVARGAAVEFRLSSEDTVHGFRIVGGDVNVLIPKRGQRERTAIWNASEAGRFTFECTRICGAGHHFMRGTIIVKEEGR